MSTATETHTTHYSEHTTDITGSPKATVKTLQTGFSQLSQQFSNRQNQGVQQNGAMPHYGGGAEKCARCSKSVYLAEKKVGAGHSFHSSCFSCQTCNRKLDATILSEHKGEIYCKTCYTRQFGVHGLASGVTMTTEQPAREVRQSRRSSYGSELDAPVITDEQIRPRAHSNDDMLRGETSAIVTDELPKMFPWRNDVIPEQHSPSANVIKPVLEKQPSRPKSQIGFEKVIESTYMVEDKYLFDNETKLYPNGTSAMINMPVISPPRRVDTTIEGMEMPTVPTRVNERSRSPSPTSRDVYQRTTSREGQSDISENFSRLTLSEINNELYANDTIMTNKMAAQNPLVKPSYSHSTSQDNTAHYRNVSPSPNVNGNRSPSPTSGYGSSSALAGGISRDSTSSPPSAFVPQHDYLNTRSSNGSALDRQPTSPSGTKTDYLQSPGIGGKYSTIGALIKPHRPVSPSNTPNDQFDD